MKEVLRVWKYALGSFRDETTQKYDNWVCIIRTLIMLQLVITNCFIVAGNIRHWNDNKPQSNNISTLSVSESYKILNLNEKKKLTKEDVNKAYLKIQKKIHPDISPETSRLSSIVNEARDILLNEIK